VIRRRGGDEALQDEVVKREDEDRPPLPWSSIVSIGGQVAGNVGIGAKFHFAVGIADGELRVECEARLVLGPGATGRIIGKVNAKTVVNFLTFIYHKLRDVNYERLSFVEPKAFKVISALIVGSLQDITSLAKGVGKGATGEVEEWWDRQVIRLGDPERRNKVAEALASRINRGPHGLELRIATPEAKGRLLAILCESKAILEDGLLTTLYEVAEATGDSKISMFQLASPSMLVGMYRTPDWGEKREKAILRVLRWVQSTRELREVCESLRIRDVFGEEGQEDDEDDREVAPDGGEVVGPQDGASGGPGMGPTSGPQTPDQPSIDEAVDDLSSGESTKRRKIPALLGFAIICMRIDGEEWGDLLGTLIRLYFGNEKPGEGEVTPQFDVA